MVRYFASFITVALLVSCGGPKKLTDGQRDEFASTLESAGRAQRSASSLKSSGRSNQATNHVFNSNGSDPIEAEMANKLKTCDATFYEPQSGQAMAPSDPFSQPMKMGFEIKGGNCPVSFTFVTAIAATGMSMNLAYEVLNPDFKKLNDVYGMTLNGEIKASESGASGGFKGKLMSQKHGEIPTEISLSGNNDSMELKMTWEFPTYTVELKAVGSQGKVEYFENGVSITEKEFQDLVAKGGSAFSQASVDKQ